VRARQRGRILLVVDDHLVGVTILVQPQRDVVGHDDRGELDIDPVDSRCDDDPGFSQKSSPYGSMKRLTRFSPEFWTGSLFFIHVPSKRAECFGRPVRWQTAGHRHVEGPIWRLYLEVLPLIQLVGAVATQQIFEPIELGIRQRAIVARGFVHASTVPDTFTGQLLKSLG
jgi:hypothetical protein